MNTETQRLKEIIRQAIHKVELAQSAGRAATGAEILDFFSSNKLVSVYSTAMNHSMNTALREMNTALQQVQQALQNAQFHLPAGLNDLWDLGSDYFFEWNIDWLSLYNLNRHLDIQSKCSNIHRQLQNLLRKLDHV